MPPYPHLFSPLQIGNITLKNRIMAAPMGTEPNTSGFLSEQNLAAYELRAKGGAAVVTRGETLIGHRADSAHGNLCNLAEQRFMPTHLQLTDVIHQHNAWANIEILHCGARAHPKYTGGVIWGPSAEMGVYGVEVQEMDEAMMEEVADYFANAAFTAKFGGFDLVMIHGAHGWLLSQFLSPLYNRRKDRFGGSLENRARFPLMVVDRIRSKVGPGFPLEYRLSGHEFMEGGYGLQEAVQFARLLDGKVDLIHVSAGTFKDVNSGPRMFPSAFLPQGINTQLAAAIKRAVQTPVAVVGAFSDPAHMEAVIANGDADLIALGRQILADPYFPEKIRQGRLEQVRPCIRCNHCLSLDYVPYVPLPSGISQCTVNPVIGRELRESYYRPRSRAKKVLIAGGGPGGLQAALSAASQGHEVILCEKDSSLGGLLQTAREGIPFKAHLRKFKDYLIKSVQKTAGIEVRLNTEVTPELVAGLDPATLICAIGARPIIPAIAGVELPHVFSVASLYKLEVTLGQRLVIVGGGLAGVEEGLAFAMEGKDVTVLEMAGEVASDAPFLHRKALLMELARKANLQIKTGSLCTKISPQGAYYRSLEGQEHFLPADNVLLAAGMQAQQQEVEKLRQAARDKFVAIGDSLKAGKVLQAIHSGYFAGKNA